MIFDFDGVIMDSEPIHLLGFQTVLRTVGVELSSEDYYSKYLGFADYECLVAVGHDFDRDDFTESLIADLTQAKTRIVQDALEEMGTALAGAVELVTSAHQAGVPLAICSGALRDEITLPCEALGIRDCFAVIVAAEDVKRGKPDPEGYAMALDLLAKATGKQLAASRTVVVEDSPVGIQAAKAISMNVLGVTSSYDREDIKDADRIVDSLAEVGVDDLRALIN